MQNGTWGFERGSSMSTRILSFILSCALVVAVVLSLAAAAFAVIGPLAGQPLDTGFSVVCAGGPGSGCAAEPDMTGARLVLDRGDLTLAAPSLSATLLRVFDVGLTGGFWVALIWMLRRFSRHVSQGRPFTSGATRKLSWMGVLLLVYPVWELIRSALWQAIVIRQPSDGAVLVHSFAQDAPAGALRLLPDFSPGLVLAGLVLLVVAEAFRIGVEVQRDSDEIV